MEITCMPTCHLTDSERAAVEYINKQSCIINLLSIEDIAIGAFVSNATVSRAVRKCGFSSFQEMKFRLSEDAKQSAELSQMNRVLSMSYTECIETIKQIDEYFNNKRKDFDLPLDIETTDFRLSVYNELLKIPYGETRSYSDIARAINNEK